MLHATEFVAQDIVTVAEDECHPMLPQLMDDADQGNPDAQNSMGKVFSAMQENTKAIGWYQKAAEQGAPEAQHNLGHCFEHGIGVENDLEHASHWYYQAATQGSNASNSSLIRLAKEAVPGHRCVRVS